MFRFNILIIILLFLFSFAKANDTLIHKMNNDLEKMLKWDLKKALSQSIKILEYVNENTPDSLKALTYKNMGVILYYYGNYDKALSFYNQSVFNYSAINDYQGISACYNNIALIFKETSNYEKALSYLYKSLAIDKKLKNKKHLAITYYNIGEIYHLTYKYFNALYFYSLSFKLENELNNKEGIADCYLNIGAAMEENQLFKEALLFYEKALNIYLSTLNYMRAAQCYNNKGVALMRLNEFYKAKESFILSLSHKDSTQYLQGRITSLLNLANLYILLGDTFNAKKSYSEALYLENPESFSKNSNDFHNMNTDDFYFEYLSKHLESEINPGISQSLFYKGIIHFNLGEVHKAVNFFKNSLEIAEYFNDIAIRKENYLYLSKSHKLLGDYKNAYVYAEKHLALSDSIYRVQIADFVSLKIFSINDIYKIETRIESNNQISKSSDFLIVKLGGLILIAIIIALYGFKKIYPE